MAEKNQDQNDSLLHENTSSELFPGQKKKWGGKLLSRAVFAIILIGGWLGLDILKPQITFKNFNPPPHCPQPTLAGEAFKSGKYILSFSQADETQMFSFECEGYLPVSFPVKVSFREHKEIEVKLTKVPVSVGFESKPLGAVVLEGENNYGKTPINSKVVWGKNTFKFKLAGFKLKVKKEEIKPIKNQVVRVNLEYDMNIKEGKICENPEEDGGTKCGTLVNRFHKDHAKHVIDYALRKAWLICGSTNDADICEQLGAIKTEKEWEETCKAIAKTSPFNWEVPTKRELYSLIASPIQESLIDDFKKGAFHYFGSTVKTFLSWYPKMKLIPFEEIFKPKDGTKKKKKRRRGRTQEVKEKEILAFPLCIRKL